MQPGSLQTLKGRFNKSTKKTPTIFPFVFAAYFEDFPFL